MERTKRRRGLRALALLACLGSALAPAAGDAPTERLDIEVTTPVYRVPAGASLPDGAYRYAMSWSGIRVGDATITLRARPDHGALEMQMTGSTIPAIEWLYRYEIEARGQVQTAPFAPDHFVVEERERGRRKRLEVRFPDSGSEVLGIRHRRGREQHYVFDSENTYDIPSATFLLLNLDYAPGDRFELDTFTGRHRHLLVARVEARETIELDGAAHQALRLHIETRSLTDHDSGKHRGSTVWVSAERPRTLLRARSETWVGALTLELEAPAALSRPAARAPSSTAPAAPSS